MSVDLRTRVDDERDQRRPAELLDDRLPAAFDSASELLSDACARLAPPRLVVEVEGEAWTLAAGEGGEGKVTCRRGGANGAGAMRLRLSAQQLGDLVDDQVTPMGWFSSGTLDLDGRLEKLLDWWLLVRGGLDGVAPTVGEPLSFVARDGSDLDLGRSFSIDDDAADVAWFLEQAGFLHVVGVFSEEEMNAVSSDMDRAAPSYAPGDGRSWWARTAGGVDRLVRMQAFDHESEAVGALVGDDRLARLGALTGDGHEWGAMDGNAIEALVKPIGVVQGISDVPWHKDCSLGRHSYECCSLTVGISVTGADGRSGQLRVAAGSHRVLTWPALLRRDNRLPVVDLPTSTGDVTVHLSCTLHMSQPPVDRERRVLYTSFRLPAKRPEGARAARGRLREIRESAPLTVSQPPGT
jgi:Phytanoyl-CoA dioxygenase (PhyH)